MRVARFPVSVALCVSFLAVQIGGLHMHVDAAGNVGGPRGVHLHAQMLHSHDKDTHEHGPDTPDHGHRGEQEHAGDNDISATEMRAGKSALAVLDLTLLPGLLVDGAEFTQIRAANHEPPPTTRKSRWRPPLRAPPQIVGSHIA